jgi:type I restriction enzyme S subunit
MAASLETIGKQISSGGTPSRKNSDYFTTSATGHLWVKSKELLDGAIEDTEERISDGGLNNSSAKYYPAHTVLVAMYGANVGQLGWLRKPATVNQAICGLVIDEQQADWRFVFYTLLLNRGDLTIQAQGAAQQNLNQDLIRQFRVDLPLLPTQRRIADILMSYDELIECNQRRIKILEAIARTLYREWFVHFRFPGHELISQVSSPLGEIPQGWEVRRVAEFADFTKGIEPGSAAYKKQSDVGLVRFLRVGDLSKRESSLFVDADLAKGRVLQPLDIAITLDGSVGEVKVGLSGAYSSGIRRVDVKDTKRLGWAFAYQLLLSDSIQAIIHAHAKGTTIKHAGTAVPALVYVSPTENVIETYERIAAPLMRQVLMLQEQVEILCRKRDLLLPRLLSGQIALEEIVA